jgi:peptidoglycan/xylan/chitin deacetylase (PgdA/CDA1 family)
MMKGKVNVMSKKKFPVILSYDCDFQALWTSRDIENTNRPVTLSLGNYGYYEGLPRILRILDKYDIKGTFNLVGCMVEKFPQHVVDIYEKGHELACHGYNHIWPEKFEKKEDEAEEYTKTNKAIKDITGYEVKGFRSPAWEFSLNTPDILEEMGLLYSSNMMDFDSIHQLEVFGKKRKLLEIPIHWALDDAAYWLYSTKIIGKAMQPLDAVENVFKIHFNVLYDEWKTLEGRENTVFSLTMHPQIIGLPPRAQVMENVIKHIKQHDDVEFVRAIDLAEKHIDLLEK